MSATSPSTLVVPPHLQTLAALALLLQKLEQLPRQASAAQYREVASRLGALLAEAEPGPALDQLLSALPAAAEVYENQRYAQAGLCRHPLQLALDTELAAAAAIRRARGRATAASPDESTRPATPGHDALPPGPPPDLRED
jgi:hypothetical protein